MKNKFLTYLIVIIVGIIFAYSKAEAQCYNGGFLVHVTVATELIAENDGMMAHVILRDSNNNIQEESTTNICSPCITWICFKNSNYKGKYTISAKYNFCESSVSGNYLPDQGTADINIKIEKCH